MKQQNCQEIFLNVLRKNKHPVTVFLSSGIKLQGVITGFDNFAIVLRRESHVQLVYKHSVSTIMPNGNISFNVDLEKLEDSKDDEVKTIEK